MQLSFALLLFPLALILSGCGTKGPLTLTPPAPKATTAKPAPTPSTTDDSSRAATGAKP